MSVKFGDEQNNEQENEININNENENNIPDGYTVIDASNLPIDEPIHGQEYCLFSFISPEGVMNCNVRLLKFRGAYPTLESANEKARELEKTDKYCKIFVGQSGRWLEFDPPLTSVENEMTSNKEHQKIIDAQRKQRLDKINALAEKHKELIEKKEKGEKERADEIKKIAVASAEVDKRKEDKRKEENKKEEVKEANNIGQKHEDKKKAGTVNRLKEKLENIKNKKKLEILESNEEKVKNNNDKDSLSKNIDEFKKKLEERRKQSN